MRGGTRTAAGARRARQPPQNTAAPTHVTYGFGRGGDVLDDHLALGAQVLFTQRRFAILVQVHVLLRTHAHTHTRERERERRRGGVKNA